MSKDSWNRQAFLKASTSLLLATGLVACGGGGGGGSGSTSPVDTIKLALEPLPHRAFQISWKPQSGAHGYRLLENIDSQSGYLPVSSLLTDLQPDPETGRLSFTLTDLSLPPRIHARYMLQVCDSDSEDSCQDAASLSAANHVDSAIGYLKADEAGSPNVVGSNIAVAADGSTLVTNAYYQARVFAKDSNGIWHQQAILQPSPVKNGFATRGLAISADGNTIVVGDHTDDSAASGINGNPDYSHCYDDIEEPINCLKLSGAAHVYIRDGFGNWSQQAYLKAGAPSENAGFGSAAALSADGNTLAIGSSSFGNNRHGRVHLFQRDGEIWSQSEIIPGIIDPDIERRFGNYLAMNDAGTLLAVAERHADSSVHVFAKESGGWQRQTEIPAQTNLPSNFWRRPVLSGDGSTLAIGKQWDDCLLGGIHPPDPENCTTSHRVGSVSVYVPDSTGSWVQQAYIQAANADESDRFGGSLALSQNGDQLLVGATYEDSLSRGLNGDPHNNDSSSSGAAYLFQRKEGQWQQSAYLKASNNDPFDGFGRAVALSADGRLIAIGAPQEDGGGTGMGSDQDDNSDEHAGALYLY